MTCPLDWSTQTPKSILPSPPFLSTLISLPRSYIYVRKSTYYILWSLAISDSLLRRETATYGHSSALVFYPNVRHGVVFPIYPIDSQAHPTVVNPYDSVFRIEPLFEFANIGSTPLRSNHLCSKVEGGTYDLVPLYGLSALSINPSHPSSAARETI